MVQSVKNLSATPLGLYDVDGSYHVAGAMGGTATLEPDVPSAEIIGIYTSSGSASVETLTAPANTALPTITGTAQVGQTLTATNGTWTGTPTPTFTRQWKADGANIAGATAMTYVPVEGDVGKVITVTVTGTNTAGNTSATSAGTAAVIAAG